MFNFKKEVDTKVSVDKQIHHDVYSAQELLLAEANRVLETPIADIEKHERLKKLCELGFANAKDIKEAKEIDDSIKAKEKLKKQIDEYQQTYPLNKFIDMDTVKLICEKYGLLLAVASDYISDIPEKNQNEILNFKVKRKHKREPHEMRSGRFWFPMSMFCYGSYNNAEDYRNEFVSPEDLLIIAPKEKLNTEGRDVKNNILKIKDPIVLQPVTEGYLIVTSWGLEASDEMVVNPIKN